MPLKLGSIVIDCEQPLALLPFWAAALGYEREGDWDEFIWLVDPRGNGPRLGLQLAEAPTPGKNRIHFDLKVGGGRDVPLAVRTQRVTATVERLVKAGADVLRITDLPDMGQYAVLLQDPEGNEFDVV